MQAMKRAQMPFTSPAPKDLVIDVRQDINFQAASGSTTLMSHSRVFVFSRDRCLVGTEHMQLNGWSRNDTNMTCVADPWLQRLEAEAHGSAAKRRRGKSPHVQNRLVDMSGNVQSLGDLGKIAVPLMFALNGLGLFENDHVEVGQLPKSQADLAHGVVVEIDASLPQSELQALRRTAMEFSDDE